MPTTTTTAVTSLAQIEDAIRGSILRLVDKINEELSGTGLPDPGYISTLAASVKELSSALSLVS